MTVKNHCFGTLVTIHLLCNWNKNHCSVTQHRWQQWLLPGCFSATFWHFCALSVGADSPPSDSRPALRFCANEATVLDTQTAALPEQQPLAPVFVCLPPGPDNGAPKGRQDTGLLITSGGTFTGSLAFPEGNPGTGISHPQKREGGLGQGNRAITLKRNIGLFLLLETKQSNK